MGARGQPGRLHVDHGEADLVERRRELELGLCLHDSDVTAGV